jgi:hypothetical protein
MQETRKKFGHLNSKVEEGSGKLAAWNCKRVKWNGRFRLTAGNQFLILHGRFSTSSHRAKKIVENAIKLSPTRAKKKSQKEVAERLNAEGRPHGHAERVSRLPLI